VRRGGASEAEETFADAEEAVSEAIRAWREGVYVEMSAAEQFRAYRVGAWIRKTHVVLRISDPRDVAAKGIVPCRSRRRPVPVVASFPIDGAIRSCSSPDGANSIRCPFNGSVYRAARTQGVIIFSTATRTVVSVERVTEEARTGRNGA